MPHELSPGKSICILGIVIGCFAILWPNIFYPMLKGSVTNTFEEEGCCDVLLDKDVNGVKLVNELCGTVLKLSDKYSSFYFPDSRLNKDAVKYCRNVIMETCDVDIHVLLKETIELGATSYKHVLDEMRTFNKSLCLKYHFDVTLELLGTPHRVRKSNATYTSRYRQERVPYSRADELHPAFRRLHPSVKDRTKAIPSQTHAVPRVPRERDALPSVPPGSPSVVSKKIVWEKFWQNSESWVLSK